MVEVFENPATFDNPNLAQNRQAIGYTIWLPSDRLFYTRMILMSPGDVESLVLPHRIFTDKVYPGDIRYEDISGPNGKPDGLIDFNDQVAMGYPTYPAIIYGFSPSVTYKGFEFSLIVPGCRSKRNSNCK